MDEMHSWIDKNIGNVFEGKQGRMLAVEASFAKAVHDGITILEMGEVIGNSREDVIEFDERLVDYYLPNTYLMKYDLESVVASVNTVR